MTVQSGLAGTGSTTSGSNVEKDEAEIEFQRMGKGRPIVRGANGRLGPRYLAKVDYNAVRDTGSLLQPPA